MIGLHLGGYRNQDPLAPWRAIAAAVILQALRDAKERPAFCQDCPHFECVAEGCSRCAVAFLKSRECLDLLRILLGRPCGRKRMRRILKRSFQIPANPRK
jgi:hypothetical protein